MPIVSPPVITALYAGILGLMVAMIGSEGIHAHVRFNLGIPDLNGGIGLIPAMVGAFGFAEVLTAMWRRKANLEESRHEDDRIRVLQEHFSRRGIELLAGDADELETQLIVLKRRRAHRQKIK